MHLLINNAGLVTRGLGCARQRWEWQFATNHLGYFAPALGLHDALALGASERDGARIGPMRESSPTPSIPGVSPPARNATSDEQEKCLDAAEAVGAFTYKTIEQRAATTLVAAVAPQFANHGGHRLDDGQVAYTVSNDAALAQHPYGVRNGHSIPTSPSNSGPFWPTC